MKVCAAQYDIAWEDVSANMRICERFFREAADASADLIVFPEMSLTGFTMNKALSEGSHGMTVRFFSVQSVKYGLDCVFGYAERIEDKVYNRLVYCSSDGISERRYSKIHPFSYGGECDIFTAGEDVCMFSLGEIDFGMTICYDLRFPELYQRLSAGCGCIIVSANWPRSRREHWITLLKARAIENQCYIIGCNRTGTGGGIEYSGDSCIISPEGTVIACAQGNDSQLITAELSASAVSDLRESFPLKNDRKNTLYRNFYE